MKRHEFTLLEVICLTPIGVIAAAVLLPFFARSSGSDSRRLSCQSNLKQINLALMQYMGDSNYVLPPARNSKHGLQSVDNWAGKLFPYIKYEEVFRCLQDSTVNSGHKNCYGYNAYLDQLPSNAVSEPGRVIDFFEVNANPKGWTQTGRSPGAVTASRRHRDGSNFAFVDGHVKWYASGVVGVLPPDRGMSTFVPR